MNLSRGTTIINNENQVHIYHLNEVVKETRDALVQVQQDIHQIKVDLALLKHENENNEKKLNKGDIAVGGAVGTTAYALINAVYDFLKSKGVF